MSDSQLQGSSLSAPLTTDQYIGKQSKATCVRFVPSMHKLITVSTAFMSETGVDVVSPIQFPGHLDAMYLISVHDIHAETLCQYRREETVFGKMIKLMIFVADDIASLINSHGWIIMGFCW